MSNLNRGSIWRKWDLHIHTPSSICQNYGGEEKWDEFITALENLPDDVKVIGINDYYFIDGYKKVMEYRKQGRLANFEKIFPILEFRIDTFGSGSTTNLQKINLHILFDIDENNLNDEISKIEDEFIRQISITGLPEHETKKLSKAMFAEVGGDLQSGFSNFVPSTQAVLKLLDNTTWNGKTFLFLGYKEWSNLEKGQQLRPFKEHLYKKVDAFFTSNAETISRSQGWLNEYGQKTLLHSGDIHDFESLSEERYRCDTWVKSDPSFNGLQQISYEPLERVNIQVNTPEMKTGYHVIDSIKISEDGFWNQEILLNPNLNTIIGGRSTGKSTLLSTIAKKISSESIDSEFINEHSDSVIVKWVDAQENIEREVEFFPQNHMYEIAKSRSETDRLIQSIIQEKDEFKKMDEYKVYTDKNRDSIISKVNNLYNIQNEIEKRNSQIKAIGNREGIANEIELLEKKLKDLNFDNSITDEDLRTYDQTMGFISRETHKMETLHFDSQKLMSMLDFEIINPTLDYQINDLSDLIKPSLKDLGEKLKEETINMWKSGVNELIGKCIHQQKYIEDEKTNLINDPVFKKVENHHKKNIAFKDLQEALNNERSKLLSIERLVKENIAYEGQKNELIIEIVESHVLFEEKLSVVCNGLEFECSGIKVEAKSNFQSENFDSFLRERFNLGKADSKTLYTRINEEYIERRSDILKEFLKKSVNKTIEYKGIYTDRNKPTVASELLSTNWFDITYELNYQNDDFYSMSQGKQAFVILKLLLEFSDKKCPILIDQPEDSLDNRAIFNELVQYLKNKKKERQILLVTHNPNVVVASDSELVIVANQHGNDSKNRESLKFCYKGGSLENTKTYDPGIEWVLEQQGIREHVCEVLEGGALAFLKREQKYNL